MRNFRDFYENKTRQSIKQLNIIAQIVEKSGFKVDHFLGEQFDDPYIYIYNPNNNTSFDGVRLYKIGDKIAYRVCREAKTHPYGNAYSLEVELMFDDLMEEGKTKPEDIGGKIIEMIAKELKSFFHESAKAEKPNISSDDSGIMGSVHIKNPLGGDYSSMVHSMDK